MSGSRIQPQSFKDWFAERHPDCGGDTIIPSTREHVWYAKVGDDTMTAQLRLADAQAEFLDALARKVYGTSPPS